MSAQEIDNAQFPCPGRAMQQPKGAPPEGYVACYRAGHPCPPAVSTTVRDETMTITTSRCPCCGQFSGSIGTPNEWVDDGSMSPGLASDLLRRMDRATR